MKVRELRRAAGLPDVAANIAAYRMSNPVTVLPISIRWISLVPSKIVKIVDYGAVSAGQRAVDPVVSARIQHGLPEGNDGFRPARARTPSQVHRRYIFDLTCHYPVGRGTRPRCQRRADGPHPGRTTGNAGSPGWALSRRHGGVTGRIGHNRATADEPAPALPEPIELPGASAGSYRTGRAA
jgi:hypothetical protein